MFVSTLKWDLLNGVHWIFFTPQSCYMPKILFVYPMDRKPVNINSYTDFGFMKLFGEEVSKDLQLDFINAVLEEETGTISSIEFAKNELLGLGQLDRKVVFDIYCKTESGERIIVEIQKAINNISVSGLCSTAVLPYRNRPVAGFGITNSRRFIV